MILRATHDSFGDPAGGSADSVGSMVHVWRTGVIVGALAAVVLATLAGVVAWRGLYGALGSDVVTKEVCQVDPTASGQQGYCVQRRHRPAGLLTGERAQLFIVTVHDGQSSPRATYAPYPFNDPEAEFDVRFEADAITVRNADGIAVTYPESFYRLG